MATDWHAWHADYDRDSPLRRRLVIVQRHIGSVLDAYAQSRIPIRVLSICAGEARDLLGAVEMQPTPPAIQGRLVELDPGLATSARRRCAELGLSGIEVVVADAGTTASYAGAVPADLILVCGVFGNISDEQVERTVRALPSQCAPDATVIWTRHRLAPDLTGAIRGWFGDSGFEEIAFEPVPDSSGSVGVARFKGQPATFRRRRLFRFSRRPDVINDDGQKEEGGDR